MRSMSMARRVLSSAYGARLLMVLGLMTGIESIPLRGDKRGDRHAEKSYHATDRSDLLVFRSGASGRCAAGGAGGCLACRTPGLAHRFGDDVGRRRRDGDGSRAAGCDRVELSDHGG